MYLKVEFTSLESANTKADWEVDCGEKTEVVPGPKGYLLCHIVLNNNFLGNNRTDYRRTTLGPCPPKFSASPPYLSGQLCYYTYVLLMEHSASAFLSLY